MPSYTMRHTQTKEEKTLILSFSERETFLKENPDWIQVPTTPRIVSGVGSNLSKTDNGWKEVLNKIKKGSGKGHTINT